MVYQTRISQTQKIWGAIAAGVLAAVLAFAFGLVAPAQAHAAQDDGALKVGAISTQAAPKMWAGFDLYAGDYERSLWSYVQNWPDNAQVTKVTTSNKGVLVVKKRDNYKDPSSYLVYPKKAGTEKITITYKLKGKTKKISGNFSVLTCPVVFKSMKLNGKALKVPTAKKGYTSGTVYAFRGAGSKGTDVTFNLELGEGWHANYISGYFYNTDNTSKYKSFEITNGKKFTVPKNYEGYINLYITDENGEQGFDYMLNIYRNKPLELAKSTYYIGHPTKSSLAYSMITEDGDKAQILSVKSSKPSVLKITKGKKFNTIKVQAKKVGSAKLTITYKVDGKKYTTSATCKAAKYPLKSVTLNGKAMNLAKYPYGYYGPKYTKSTVKVKFTPAAGWKLAKLQYMANGKTKTIKNGATVTKPKGKMVFLFADLKKGKTHFYYEIDLG